MAILGRKGWDVVHAPTLAEARDRLATPPACVVLDLMLPDGDGESVLRVIRSAGLACRVIVTTGVAEGARLDEVRGLRPDAVLRKPIHLVDLLRALQGPPPTA